MMIRDEESIDWKNSIESSGPDTLPKFSIAGKSFGSVAGAMPWKQVSIIDISVHLGKYF
jgi:hypothetical protein